MQKKKKSAVLGKIGSNSVSSSIDELQFLGDPGGKPTLYHGDDLPDLRLSNQHVAIVPPGVNHQAMLHQILISLKDLFFKCLNTYIHKFSFFTY